MSKPNITTCPDGSIVIVPVTGEQATAINQAIGITGPNDPDQPVFNGAFVLTVPASRAEAVRAALKEL